MSGPLCASPRCAVPGRHTDDCERDACPSPRQHADRCGQVQHCRGCAPGRAADGSWLCAHCTRRIGRDAVEAARLWYEIGWVLNARGSNGTPVLVSDPHPGLNIAALPVGVRADIRDVLAAWCRQIADARGIHLPGRLVKHGELVSLPSAVEGPLNLARLTTYYAVDESQHALGAYIAKHAPWLAAQDFAADAAVELRTLRTRAWSAAYPEGASVVEIGTCPEVDAVSGPCSGTVRAILREADSTLPNRVVCDADSGHMWTSERWKTLGRAMGKLWGRTQPADIIALAYGRPIGTIYWLASTHKWRSVREGRRSRYFTDDVTRTLEGTTA